jgi:nucleoside phosphorylase
MEGAGLYGAAHEANVEWALVKGICDWADGHKGHNKRQRQKRAATNAARLVHQMLRQGGWRPHQPGDPTVLAGSTVGPPS